MDDQIFQAMLGTAMPADGPPSSAMANELRGQRDLGQLLSIAPGMEKTGQNMQTGALAQAKQIGDRRQQGLTRTRQMERDKLADDRYATEEKRKDAALKLDADILKYERGGWTDIEERADSQGNVALYGLMDGRGALQKIPDSDGLKETDPYAGRGKGTGKGMKIKLPGTDAVIWKNTDGSIEGPKGEDFADFAAFAAAYPKFASAEAAYNSALAKGSEAFASSLEGGIADEVTDVRTSAAQQNSSYVNSLGNLQAMLYQLDQGANTGQIYDWFPTITNATSMFESLVSAETLDLLNKYQLKPVSDADMKVLKSVASPGMDNEAMKIWATNKIKVLKRAQASGRVFEDWVRANEKVPSGAERDQLEADMAAAADAVGPVPGAVNTSGGEAETTQEKVDAISARRAELMAEKAALQGENTPASALPKTMQGVQ